MRPCIYPKANGQSCGVKVTQGEPPLCSRHDRYRDDFEEADMAQVVLGAVFSHPEIKRIFGKLGHILDQASGFIDEAPRIIKDRKTRKSEITLTEARSTLGFSETEKLTTTSIKDRRRSFMQVLHPDKPGGSTYASQRINAAADALLATLK